MRISSQDALRPSGGDEAIPAASSARPVATGDAQSRPVRAVERVITHPGTYRYSAALNERLTGYQQADAYVETLARHLEELKANLSQELTQRRVNPENLSESLSAVAEEWKERTTRSAGTIDDQLRLATEGGARQRFRIRGLDMAALVSGKGETLTFFTGQSGSPALPVTIPPGADEREVLARFNQALARAGIRALQDDEGRLAFEVAENDWNVIKDRLSLRGGGNIFPAGQPNRVRLDTERPALQPERWDVADHAAIRRSLRDVIEALDKITQVRQSLRRAMLQTDAAIAQLARANEDVWAQSFVGDFAAALNQPGNFSALAQAVPALIGISRYRVVSLLAL
ncbi:hypothetical protein [Paludibacterium paludis]|uniref:Flagellin n=1 Tax=Paludibacterium paludis TaxID=1225769 RepID=A0A918NYE1_9NEIS|nr:hypothetical protein [Paludibacterium paludis]GGY04846.1 flagellin [Paludibacterium paludis]